mmetsp:Transcript_46628/g.116811  ORF Transcript_46628/g.116811 Transcript_46628/m.116811 type:complete len:242 (-) Transcript_46628:483-1208(-)
MFSSELLRVPASPPGPPIWLVTLADTRLLTIASCSNISNSDCSSTVSRSLSLLRLSLSMEATWDRLGVFSLRLAGMANGMSSRSCANGRLTMSLSKHRTTRSWYSWLSWGMSGGFSISAMANMMAKWFECSLKGGFPVAIWMRVQPTDQTSDLREYIWSVTTSGDMNTGVPLKLYLKALALVSLAFPAAVTESALSLLALPTPSFIMYLDAPKSASLQAPLESTRMFCPLTSRCTIPLSCR